ncbi:hypothetical protein [Trichococcus collinsii]|uniref:CopG family transcriptional regulator n=1 Tax=Trichococcus collinsii TaxID=157076 RepID=A0AB37ZYY9_9LACT|nr:hypothetical protein [Trichococcus collinsii]CZQ79991.1 Hypothetical protein Tcol_2 [Trichococcus collinsii]SDZ97484.1 hypothetical protein SAMN04488525_101763 [Trichococcus collinsii]
MDTEDKVVRIINNFPESLVKRVEDYQHQHHMRTRKDAFIELIEKGLKQEEPAE